jgi:hypothetical protein
MPVGKFRTVGAGTDTIGVKAQAGFAAFRINAAKPAAIL